MFNDNVWRDFSFGAYVSYLESSLKSQTHEDVIKFNHMIDLVSMKGLQKLIGFEL